MGCNSIRSNLGKEEIISDIKMSLAANLTKLHNNFMAVVVEGKSDVQFFKSKLADSVDIYESFSGKSGVKEIIDFFSNEANVIGICDRDYDDISQIGEKIFYYDYCCLEIMLAADDDAFETVANELYEGTLNYKHLRENIIRNLCWLSTFRMLSARNNWDIRFSGISIQKAFEKNTETINNEKIREKINMINGNGIESKIFEEIGQKSELITEYDDLLLITQGHDFINCLKCFCSDCGFNSNSIGTLLRCSYHISNFRKSFLFQSLAGYQSITNMPLV